MQQAQAISFRLILSVAVFGVVLAAASLSGAHQVNSPPHEVDRMPGPIITKSFSTIPARICAPTNSEIGGSRTIAGHSAANATLLSCVAAPPQAHGRAAPTRRLSERYALALPLSASLGQVS